MEDDWRASWDPVIAQVGQEIGAVAPRPAADRVEAGAVRRYLEPLEFDCPLHYDAEVARAHGHPDIIAPYTSVLTFALGPFWRPGQHVFASAERNAQPEGSGLRPRFPEGMPQVSGMFATQTDIDYLRPVVVGERLWRRGNRLVGCEPKETRVGRGAFLTLESEAVDEAGEPVARIRSGLYLYNPHPRAAA